jgi:hypothetical protein
MSQPDNITCTGLTTQVFSEYDRTAPNKAVYHGADHADSSRHKLEIYRTAPKRQGNSLGIRKSALKVTLDVTVPTADGAGTNVVPCLLEVSSNLPVGISDADRLRVLQETVDLIKGDSNFNMTSLQVVGEI